MARRRRKRKPQKRLAQSSAALRRNGLRAFERGDYTRAIETWERVGRQTPEMRPTSALAEAYSRRGLNYLYAKSPNLQAGLDDLGQAANLLPKDPCYAYHLGLAAHRQGDLDGAIRAYQIARQSQGEFATRTAYPLALALFQQGDDPSTASVWASLSDKERAMLSHADAFRRRPYVLPADAPLLWRGLAMLDAGDREKARTVLNQVLESPGNPSEEGIAHYYLGVLAAQDKDLSEAGRQWSATRMTGLELRWLRANMGELYHRLAEDRLLKENVESALLAATEAARHKSGDKRLDELFSQVYQRLAYQAVSAGHWTTALDHWDKAVEVGGSNFRLAYNRALAYEHAERFVAAGETWREALRRRPRRADHPDAISDEQVARLWRRTAEAYHKAGYYQEATNVYRQALKWNPDDVETRLALAEGLLNDGRLQAAQSELNRILERDPDNVLALLHLGEAIAESDRRGYRSAAPKYWKQVLELDPRNAHARQLLADFYQNQAEKVTSWGNYAAAIEMYQQALEYQPQNARILAALGGCYLKTGDKTTALSYIEEALGKAPNDLMVYDQVIHVWLDENDADQAWKVMSRAEAAIDSIPFDFYIIQAAYCIEHLGGDMARPWLECAVEKAPPDRPVLAIIGETVATLGDSEIAQEYLERAIEAGQKVGQSYLMLGVLAARDGDLETANKHWRRAEKIARRDHNTGLRERVAVARSVFGRPYGLLDLLLRSGMSLDGSGPFEDFF